MRPIRYSTLLLLVLAVATLTSTRSLEALSVVQMNLDELTARADKIFRGTVQQVIPGTARIGGSDLPTVMYRIQVDEAFSGDFPIIKGVRVVDVRMLGTFKPVQRGGSRTVIVLPTMDQMETGEQYLLFVTRPSAAGLSSTVGLGQGKFRIVSAGERELTVNDVDNNLLFRGMDAEDLPARGPVPYAKLAERIRKIVDRTGR